MGKYGDLLARSRDWRVAIVSTLIIGFLAVCRWLLVTGQDALAASGLIGLGFTAYSLVPRRNPDTDS